ncbi:hypothetical protein [Streptomyces sp. NPDC060184]|uniref:hypothetical protein n=1 Tax=Streptomyces sp. NPDC060184 TaxID=3347064 RepID=UPI0036471015
MTVTLCLHCTDRDAQGGQLCPVCARATLVRLQCLPELYTALEDVLAPSGGSALGVRGPKPTWPPLPVREDVLDLRLADGMLAPLESWVDAVREERARPPRGRDGSATGRVQRATAELIGHMPWIAVSWPQAGVFAGEIRDLARDVRSVISPSSASERGTRIGACPAVHEDGTVCGAALRLGHGERVVTCSWCGCTYPPATWVGLKVLIDEDAKVA